jgi:hypothetical protein
MAHIAEPKGIDFIIQSKPLTDQDRQDISKFIADYKAKKKPEIKKAEPI